MKEKISVLAIVVNAVLTASKIFVGLLTGSVLVLAEGLHSLSDVFASTIGYAGIKISQKPSDKEHPYGHYKFEVLSGLIITLILFTAAVGAIYEAYQKFQNPESLEFSLAAFAIMAAAVVVNEIMAKVKISIGKKENSISLISDGVHSRVDVFASLGVIAGLVVARYWDYADATFAFLIGLFIIKESFTLGKVAIDSLLDVSAGEEIENQIKDIVKSENIDLSSVKTQRKGSAITANLEVVFPKNLSVKKAAKLSEKLRAKLISKIDNLQYVAIQISSHNFTTDFYQPAFGKGFGWQRQEKFKEKTPSASGDGPGGYCVCQKCGFKTEHQAGIPCSSLKCPKCKKPLTRKQGK